MPFEILTTLMLENISKFQNSIIALFSGCIFSLSKLIFKKRHGICLTEWKSLTEYFQVLNELLGKLNNNSSGVVVVLSYIS